MKIWLASADISLIEKYIPTGVFAGVITNPHVVAEAQRPPLEFFRDVCSIAPAAYYQLRQAPEAEMLTEADRFLSIDPNKMRIKVPATQEGFRVVHKLSSRGLEIMATVVPTAPWLIFAMAAGARIIAPYGSMLQRRGQASKTEEVVKMQRIIDAQKSSTELCVGIYDVTELPFYAANGVRSCFVWGRDVAAYLKQPLVEEALESFEKDWRSIEQY